MHAAGLLESPLDSTGFMRWGGGGAGSWVRIYANREHVFAVIAGLRWDTSMTEDGDPRSGPGWSEYTTGLAAASACATRSACLPPSRSPPRRSADRRYKSASAILVPEYKGIFEALPLGSFGPQKEQTGAPILPRPTGRDAKRGTNYSDDPYPPASKRDRSPVERQRASFGAIEPDPARERSFRRQRLLDRRPARNAFPTASSSSCRAASRPAKQLTLRLPTRSPRR